MHWTVIYCYIMILVQFITVCFHSCGFYLLRCIRKNGNDDIQLILVMNLSASEVFLNISYIIIFSLNISRSSSDSHDVYEIVKYIDIVSSTFINFVYYLTMIYIAINKILEVLLNLKYELHCNKTKTKYLLGATWILGFGICVAVIISVKLAAFQYQDPITYFYTTLDIAYILIAVTSHGYVFYVYKQSRSGPLQSRCRLLNSRKCSLSTWKTFRGSRFYISFILIFSFVFLTILPKLVYFFIYPHIELESGKMVSGIIVGVLYHISFLADAFIYVFVHRPVKNLLWKKLRTISCLRNTVRTMPHVFEYAIRTQITVVSPMVISTTL